MFSCPERLNDRRTSPRVVARTRPGQQRETDSTPSPSGPASERPAAPLSSVDSRPAGSRPNPDEGQSHVQLLQKRMTRVLTNVSSVRRTPLPQRPSARSTPPCPSRRSCEGPPQSQSLPGPPRSSDGPRAPPIESFPKPPETSPRWVARRIGWTAGSGVGAKESGLDKHGLDAERSDLRRQAKERLRSSTHPQGAAVALDQDRI